MSDGTAAGTKMVINIANGSNVGVTNLCVVGTKVYFSFYSPDIAYGGLWVSNGTGTQVKKIQGYINQGNNQLTAVGNKLFFVNTGELWATDGTENNAYQVKDIWPGVTPSSPDHFTAFKNLLCFVANDGSNGREIWRSNGTAAGTYMLKDINTVAKQSANPLYLTVVDSALFFFG